MKSNFLFLLAFFSLPLSSQWVSYSNTNVPELVSAEVRSIALDNKGILWFGTANGLVSYDGQDWKRYSKEEHSIADNSINQLIFRSEDNSLRLATDNGSNTLDILNNPGILATYQTSNSGIYDDKVYSTGVNENGVQAFGTGKGLSIYNNTIWGSLQNMLPIDSLKLADFPVKAIVSYNDNTFITSDGKGIFLAANEVDGMTYVTNWVFPYNIPSSDNIRTAIVDIHGNQWYGTDEGAVFHEGIQAQQGWNDPYTNSSGLPDNRVNAIFEDSYGNIWFGTENGAAVKKKDNSWSSYSTADGLVSNKIMDLAEGPDNKIWFATDTGLSSFSPSWISDAVLTQPSVLGLNIHPNPASEGAWIKYQLPSPGPLRLAIYDISGKLVKSLKDEFRAAGEYEYFWNIKDDQGISPAPGIYFLRMQSGHLTTTHKLIITR